MNNGALPDIIEWPKLKLGSRTFTIKLDAAAIVRLREQDGIDLFEQPPSDAAADRVAAIDQQLVDMNGADPEARDTLLREREEAQPFISEARRNWVNPLQAKDWISRLSTYGAIIGACTGQNKYDVLTHFGPEQLVELDAIIAQVLKKVSARIEALNAKPPLQPSA